MANKINDFGEKIGGARKDLWRSRGLRYEDTYEMNEAEKKLYVVRDNIWPLPDAKKQVESGMSPFVAYWIRKVRQQTYSKPKLSTLVSFETSIERYINSISSIRDKVMEVRESSDIYSFYSWLSGNGNYIDEWYHGVRCYDIVNLSYRLDRLKAHCELSDFPYGTNSKRNKERKKSFIPPQLSHIEREGKNYRLNCNVNEKVWQKKFNFRGVEFGNWMTQKDRQVSMNYCYDALLDLAVILDIADTDIAFNGKLALAFGARGCSRASAHYEPLREVINLTKMHGAGCTAHEWMHALDDRLAKFCGITDGKLASECSKKDKSLLPESFNKLVRALKFDADGNKTDYFRGSIAFDGFYAKEGHGYWQSNPEMLARAFACYAKDCYGRKSDYLFAHADVYEFEYDNQSICAIPQDEEREILNELFDKLFYDLKEIGFLNSRTSDDDGNNEDDLNGEMTTNISNKDVVLSSLEEICKNQDINGQYVLDFAM